MLLRRLIGNEAGGSLVELLITMMVVVLTAIGALGIYAYESGAVSRQGNRRAAQEIARMRLEQILSSGISAVTPPDDASAYFLTCAGDPCAWTFSGASASETVNVNGLAAQPMITVVQRVADPANPGTPNLLECDVKVWFWGTGTAADDNYHRVHLRALRAL